MFCASSNSRFQCCPLDPADKVQTRNHSQTGARLSTTKAIGVQPAIMIFSLSATRPALWARGLGQIILGDSDPVPSDGCGFDIGDSHLPVPHQHSAQAQPDAGRKALLKGQLQQHGTEFLEARLNSGRCTINNTKKRLSPSPHVHSTIPVPHPSSASAPSQSYRN